MALIAQENVCAFKGAMVVSFFFFYHPRCHSYAIFNKKKKKTLVWHGKFRKKEGDGFIIILLLF